MDFYSENLTEEEKLEMYQRKLNDVYIDGEKSSVEDNELIALRVKLGLPEGKCQVLEQRFFEKMNEDKEIIEEDVVQEFENNFKEVIFNNPKQIDTLKIAASLISELSGEEKKQLDKQLIDRGITNDKKMKKMLLDLKKLTPNKEVVQSLLIKIKDSIADMNFPLGQQKERLDYFVDKHNLSLSGINQLILHSSAALSNNDMSNKTKVIEYSNYIKTIGEVTPEVKKSANIVLASNYFDLDVVIPVTNDKEQVPYKFTEEQIKLLNKGASLQKENLPFEKRLEENFQKDLKNFFISMVTKEPYEPKTDWNNPIWSEGLSSYIQNKPMHFFNNVNLQKDFVTYLKYEKSENIKRDNNLFLFNELNTIGEIQDSYNKSLKEDVINFVEEYFPDVNIEETKIFIPSEYGMDGDKNKLHVLVGFNSADISDDTLFNELNDEVQPFEDFKIDWFPIDTKNVGSIKDFLDIKKEQNHKETKSKSIERNTKIRKKDDYTRLR